MAADVMRLLQQHDSTATGRSVSQKRQFLAPTPPDTVGDHELRRFLSSAAASLRGVQARGTGRSDPTRAPYFAASFKPTHPAHPDTALAPYHQEPRRAPSRER